MQVERPYRCALCSGVWEGEPEYEYVTLDDDGNVTGFKLLCPSCRNRRSDVRKRSSK